MSKILLKGPGKYKNKGNEYRRYSKSDIIEVRLQLNGRNFLLEENNLSIIDRGDKLYIYHSFDYIEDGKLIPGRCYNTQWRRDLFKTLLENRINMNYDIYENENFENIGPAKFTITFTDSAAEKLRNF